MPGLERLLSGERRRYPILDRVKCGIIGYGGAFNMGKRHGESMLLTKRMHPEAVCDVDEARLEQAIKDFPGVSVYTDILQMLEEADIDLCAIILPHDLHAPVAMQCLSAGKHVVLEKPMCITDAEAQHMIHLARMNSVMLSVFHNRRWDGDFLALREVVQDERLIGDVYHVEMFGGGYGEPGNWWRSVKSVSGGLFYDWGAHYLDWLLQLIPEKVTGVTGFYHKLKWHSVTNEDNVEAVIRFANGCVAYVQMSSLAMVGKERWRILGSEGAVLSAQDKLVVHCLVNGRRAVIDVPHKPSDWDAYYRNIADHLCEDAPLAVKPEEARRVIAILETAEKSSASGVTEPVPTEVE